jgi:hypothetical protein
MPDISIITLFSFARNWFNCFLSYDNCDTFNLATPSTECTKEGQWPVILYLWSESPGDIYGWIPVLYDDNLYTNSHFLLNENTPQ